MQGVWDWLIVFAAAILGVAARLGHMFATRYERAEAAGTPSKGISLGEGVAAMVAAPALGIIALGVGRYFHMADETIAAMAGFAGLAGPSALLAFWDKVVDPLVNFLRPNKGG